LSSASLIQLGMSLRDGFGTIIFRMVIDMNENLLQIISQLQAFLAGTLEVRFGYARLNRPDKGVVQCYLLATCGYSRAQLTQLLARVLDGQRAAQTLSRPGPCVCAALYPRPSPLC
jgi:hypothetical protein